MKPSNTNLWLFQPAWGLDFNIGSDQMAPSILTSGFVGEQENSHQHFSNMAICVEKLPYIM